MNSEINIGELNNYIQKTETGELDLERSIQIIRELSAAIFFQPENNILIDLSNTTLSAELKVRLMEVVMVCVDCKPHSFEKKIASVVPDDQERIAHSKIFEAGMRMKDFQYRFFTNYDEATKWLSNAEGT